MRREVRVCDALHETPRAVAEGEEPQGRQNRYEADEHIKQRVVGLSSEGVAQDAPPLESPRDAQLISCTRLVENSANQYGLHFILGAVYEAKACDLQNTDMRLAAMEWQKGSEKGTYKTALELRFQTAPNCVGAGPLGSYQNKQRIRDEKGGRDTHDEHSFGAGVQPSVFEVVAEAGEIVEAATDAAKEYCGPREEVEHDDAGLQHTRVQSRKDRKIRDGVAHYLC